MMALLLPHPMPHYPQKRRRTATSVLAGHFDPLPQRDVLTSLLNGVGPNKDVEGEEEIRKMKKKKDARKDKRLDSSARRDTFLDLTATMDVLPVASSSSHPPPLPAQQPPKKSKTFWTARPERPNIQLMPMERLGSVTPPPGYSPVNLPSDSPTPGPCMSTSTSRTSSKRPRTPDDDQDLAEVDPQSTTTPPPVRKERKKRFAHKKGWKGWIEGSPVPSDKLINLDSAPVLQERRTRSGKNFDAISVGKDSWV